MTQMWLHKQAVRLIPGWSPRVYQSQNGQDMYVHHKFFPSSPRGLFFVEFGASDGVTNSNTYFFEKQLQWRGVCVEPVKADFQRMREARPGCLAVHGVVLGECPASRTVEITVPKSIGTAVVSDGIKAHTQKRLRPGFTRETVPCHELQDVLREAGVRRVDYMSIDTEGSELDVVRRFPWHEFDVRVVQIEVVEQSAQSRRNRDELIAAFEVPGGYELDAELEVSVSQFTTDLVFRRKVGAATQELEPTQWSAS
jgi:FkbM family methyltransferase